MTPGSGPRGGAVLSGLVRHIPVLLSEVVGGLAPRDGETYIDGVAVAGVFGSWVRAPNG